MESGVQDIVLYPTDTLYGLGVDATDTEAVERLRELKGRAEEKSFTIAVDSLEMMEEYVTVTPLARRLAAAFLPGKLTLVLQSKCATPGCRTLAEGVVAEDGSVGVRIPNKKEALELIRTYGKPITATSANVSGMQTRNVPQEILKQFGEKAAWISRVIDGGELQSSAPSTIVDARSDVPIVLREGAIDKSLILDL